MKKKRPQTRTRKRPPKPITTVGRPVIGTIYYDAGGHFRWVIRHGKKTASSGEAFASKYNAGRALHDFVLMIRTRPFRLKEEGKP